MRLLGVEQHDGVAAIGGGIGIHLIEVGGGD
jgi:hypothetical protein